MKSRLFNIAIFALIIGVAAWLYTYEKAAMPGELSSAHEGFNDCRTCHTPWQGVENQTCLQCHFFDEVSMLKPQVRFHEAGKYCLSCHTEHRGAGAGIAKMDHTLLNGALECTRCHVEPHASKFGSDCRACHEITAWRIEGFRHPDQEKKNCHQCHQAPESHYHEAFWEEIRKGHVKRREEQPRPSPEECWRCHITHRWDHLRMVHDLN